MTNKQLKSRLKLLARLGIGEANKKNPFLTKSQAFCDFNNTRGRQ